MHVISWRALASQRPTNLDFDMKAFLVLLTLAILLALVAGASVRRSSPLPNSGEPFEEDPNESQLLAEKFSYLVSPPPSPPSSSPAKPKSSAAANTSTTTTKNKAKRMSYYGGPVIPQVNLIPVFWTKDVKFIPELTAFYRAYVSASQYFSNTFSMYSTSKQKILPGAVGSPFVDDNTVSSSAVVVTDLAISSRLRSLISSGKIPPATSNSLYVVHFPVGVTISRNDKLSCTHFCAYHWSVPLGTSCSDTTSNKGNLQYAVVPDFSDPTSGCYKYCGSSALNTVLERLQMAGSHEVAEALTDPLIGCVSKYASPLAWYSQTMGEMADACNQKTRTALLVGIPTQPHTPLSPTFKMLTPPPPPYPLPPLSRSLRSNRTQGDGKNYLVQMMWDNVKLACV